MAAAAAAPPAPGQEHNNNDQTHQQATHTSRLLDLTRRITQRNQHNGDSTTTTTTPTRPRSTTPTTPPPRKRAAPSNDTPTNNDHENDSDPYDDNSNWTTVAKTAARLIDTRYNQPADYEVTADSQNTFSTLSSTNRYSILGERPEDSYNEETDRYHGGNPNDVEMNEEDLDEWDNMSESDRSHPLLQPDNENPTNNPSQNTSEELHQITAFVHHHNSAQLPAIEEYIEKIQSFSTDTDAQDAWEFAERLVKQKRPPNSRVAGPRPGHVDQHETQGQGAK